MLVEVYDLAAQHEVSLTQRDIFMLKRVSFSLARAEDRVPYTHFVHHNGNVAAFYALHEIAEARVGIICDDRLPSNEQMEQMLVMCRQAVATNEMIAIDFGPGTAIFEPWMDTMVTD